MSNNNINKVIDQVFEVVEVASKNNNKVTHTVKQVGKFVAINGASISLSTRFVFHLLSNGGAIGVTSGVAMGTGLPAVLFILGMLWSVFPNAMTGYWEKPEQPETGEHISNNYVYVYVPERDVYVWHSHQDQSLVGTEVVFVDGLPMSVSNDNPVAASVSDAGVANNEVISITKLTLNDIPQMEVEDDKKVFNFPTYGNPFANTELSVEYSVENKTIRWGRETYKFNERLVRVQKNFGFEVDPYIFTVVNVNQVIAEILATVAKKPHMKAGTDFSSGSCWYSTYK